MSTFSGRSTDSTVPCRGERLGFEIAANGSLRDSWGPKEEPACLDDFDDAFQLVVGHEPAGELSHRGGLHCVYLCRGEEAEACRIPVNPGHGFSPLRIS